MINYLRFEPPIAMPLMNDEPGGDSDIQKVGNRPPRNTNGSKRIKVRQCGRICKRIWIRRYQTKYHIQQCGVSCQEITS